jgi:hypothetical protein
MKRTITTLALAASMMLLTIPAAFANSENSRDAAGAGSTECRPGAQNNDLIGSWELMDKDDYIADVTAVLTERFEAGLYGEMTGDEFQLRLDGIPDRADATWAFCDKNLDGWACVMKTVPSPYYWTILDNRPFSN